MSKKLEKEQLVSVLSEEQTRIRVLHKAGGKGGNCTSGCRETCRHVGGGGDASWRVFREVSFSSAALPSTCHLTSTQFRKFS